MVNKQESSSQASCLDKEVVNLGDVSSIIMGQSPSGKTYNTVGVGSPLLNGPTEFGTLYPTAIQWTSNPTKFCDNGDILVCVRGSSTGRMNVADQKYCIGRGLAAIRANTNIADQTYIRFHVERLASSILSQATGSTFPNIDKKRLENLAIFCPSLSEQRKIASILTSIDNLIENTGAIIEQTEKVKRALMQKLLIKGIGHTNFKDTEIGEIPMGWQVRTLKEFTNHITKGATPTTNGYKWEAQGVSFLRSECVKDGIFSMKGISFISEEAHKMMNRSVVKGGDILVSITGNIGRACIYPNTYPDANINQHIARVRVINQNELNSLFLMYYINTNKVRENFYLIKTGLAYPQLSLKQVQDLQIPVPPLFEQEKIASILFNYDMKIHLEQRKMESLKQMKVSLMQTLLTGKVRVNVEENIEVVV